ncbi:MAG: hypothetical protein K2O17_05040 [Bacteroidaceae bacterium]|nr:hypothetical protein [Bacteroidaceae bacterium]
MKRLLFSLVALALTSICFAQDVLVKKDGSTILAKILRITETEVEYKNYDNPDGPTRVISISNLLRINYQNGQSETFAAGTSDDIVTRETATKFSDDRKLLQMYNSMQSTAIAKRAKRLKIAGWAVGGTLVVGGIVMTSFLHMDCYEWYSYGGGYYIDHYHGVPLGTGIPMIIAGVSVWTGCYVRAKNLEKKSKYSVDASPVFQQEFNVGKNERLMVGVDMLNDNTMRHQTVGMGLRYNF